MQIALRYCKPSALSRETRDQLWNYVSTCVRRSREAFERALDKTDEVELAWSVDGALRAFIAIKVHEVTVGRQRMTVIHTPWAIFDPACRKRNLVQKAGLRAFVRERFRHPWRRTYWMFGASTYISYLLLPRNLLQYWPRPGHTTPMREQAVINDVMRQNAETNWDPEAGVIHRHGVSRYQEGVTADDPAALSDPDIRFYATRNPGQTDGDTLICICPLNLANWLSILRNALRRLLSPRRR